MPRVELTVKQAAEALAALRVEGVEKRAFDIPGLDSIRSGIGEAAGRVGEAAGHARDYFSSLPGEAQLALGTAAAGGAAGLGLGMFGRRRKSPFATAMTGALAGGLAGGGIGLGYKYLNHPQQSPVERSVGQAVDAGASASARNSGAIGRLGDWWTRGRAWYGDPGDASQGIAATPDYVLPQEIRKSLFGGGGGVDGASAGSPVRPAMPMGNPSLDAMAGGAGLGWAGVGLHRDLAVDRYRDFDAARRAAGPLLDPPAGKPMAPGMPGAALPIDAAAKAAPAGKGSAGKVPENMPDSFKPNIQRFKDLGAAADAARAAPGAARARLAARDGRFAVNPLVGSREGLAGYQVGRAMRGNGAEPLAMREAVNWGRGLRADGTAAADLGKPISPGLGSLRNWGHTARFGARALGPEAALWFGRRFLSGD